jgi:branched-chain amino acid transport system ATP-binding protein
MNAATISATSSGPGSVLLETNALSKAFKGLIALKDHSLRIGAGEIVGVIGPNGSGKSTLFNLITGFIRPTGGKIQLAQKSIHALDPASITRLGVARTFQGTRLFKTLTVLENVRAGAQLRFPTGTLENILGLARAGSQGRSIDARAFEVLELVGLADQARVIAGDLPYGDQRRLEIARALATQPKLLMMDEPAAGLDARETATLLDLIRSIRDRYGLSVMVIEHDMDLIMNLCERIQVLAYGETICEGSPAQVQANPRVREAYLGGEASDA